MPPPACAAPAASAAAAAAGSGGGGGGGGAAFGLWSERRSSFSSPQGLITPESGLDARLGQQEQGGLPGTQHTTPSFFPHSENKPGVTPGPRGGPERYIDEEMGGSSPLEDAELGVGLSQQLGGGTSDASGRPAGTGPGRERRPSGSKASGWSGSGRYDDNIDRSSDDEDVEGGNCQRARGGQRAGGAQHPLWKTPTAENAHYGWRRRCPVSEPPPAMRPATLDPQTPRPPCSPNHRPLPPTAAGPAWSQTMQRHSCSPCNTPALPRSCPPCALSAAHAFYH